MEKYIRLAKELGMVNAMLISPQDIFFDVRAILKCRWGCNEYFEGNVRCSTRGTTFQERVDMVKSYSSILLLHSHDARQLSQAVIEIEKAAFLDGYYFSFGIRTCNLCNDCHVLKGEACPFPKKVRPCDQAFGIDVFKTVRKLGLSVKVLQKEDDIQNRYGFVLID